METVNDKLRLTAAGTISVLGASLAALALGTALAGQTAAAADTETTRTVTTEESMAGTMSESGSAEANELLPNDGAQSDAADADMGNADLAQDDGTRSEEPFLDEDMSSNAFDEAAPYDDLAEQGSRPVDDGLSATLPTTSANNPGNNANDASDQ